MSGDWSRRRLLAALGAGAAGIAVPGVAAAHHKPWHQPGTAHTRAITSEVTMRDFAVTLGAGATPWLPFDMPSRAVLAASAKKVWAHYFCPFPTSVDDDPAGATEYWQQYWLPPGGNEGGTDHTVYGGYVRDRKPFRAPRGGDFMVADKVDEVNQAISVGLDGFIVDILQISPNTQWARFLDLIEAANTVGDPYFRLVCMPDSNTSATASSTTLADNLANIAAEPCIYWHDDAGTPKLMIAPFAPEKAPNGAGSGGSPAVTFWDAVMDRLSVTYSIPSLFWPCYVATWTSAAQAPAFDTIAYGHSRWGDRDPVACSAENTSNRLAPSHCHTTYSKPWMHFAGPQDERPSISHGQKYWESGGSDAMRASWAAAIDGGAEWVQIPTWDDFSESAQICPTRDSGFAWADIFSYYLCWFKMGAAPTIVRDAIYLIHRKQPVTGVTYTGSQSAFMTLNGSTTARNEIEALVFLTAPADVEILVDGVVQGGAQACSAGVTAVKRTLVNGTVSARIVRAAVEVQSVTSPHTVSTTQPVEDLLYRATSSRRV